MIEIVMPYRPDHFSEYPLGTLYRDRNPQNGLGENSPVRKIIYFDSRPLTRECVARWLATKIPEFQILATSDSEEVIWLGQKHADLALVLASVDARQIGDPKVAAQFEMLCLHLPHVPLAIVTDVDHRAVGANLLNALRGFIPTSMPGSAVLDAVRSICDGGRFAPAEYAWAAEMPGSDRSQAADNVTPPYSSAGSMTPHPSGIAADYLASPPHPTSRTDEPSSFSFRRETDLAVVQKRPLDGLTPRQSEILNCLRRGLSNKLIAYELQMCESTVKIHVRNIMKKIGATNRTQVVSMTWRWFETTAGST